MTPQEMLEKLKKTTNSRSHRALDAIFEVCEQQVEQGINDFSYTTIARLGEKRGVPKAQSIRNATGEPYRVLIQSFADSFGKQKIRVTSREDDWIKRIQDPNTKLLVRIQEAELRSLNKKLKEILPINSVIEVNDISTADQIQKLSDLERKSLEFLIMYTSPVCEQAIASLQWCPQPACSGNNMNARAVMGR